MFNKDQSLLPEFVFLQDIGCAKALGLWIFMDIPDNSVLGLRTIGSVLRTWILLGFFQDLDRFSQDLDIVCCSTIQRWQDIAAIETLFDRPEPFVVEWMKISGFRIYFTKMGKEFLISAWFSNKSFSDQELYTTKKPRKLGAH